MLEDRYSVIDSSDNLKLRFETRELPTVARFLFDYEENAPNAVAIPFAWGTYGGDGSAPRGDTPVLVDLPCPHTPIGEAALRYLTTRKLRHKVVREWSEGLYPGPVTASGEPLTYVPVPLFRMAELGLVRASTPPMQDEIPMHASIFTIHQDQDAHVMELVNNMLSV